MFEGLWGKKKSKQTLESKAWEEQRPKRYTAPEFENECDCECDDHDCFEDEDCDECDCHDDEW